jgi:outer membrane protein OmpA-like peptidoglycan-associated protein
LWADLGVTSRPLPEAVRASLKTLWTAILHDAGLSPVTFAPDETQAGPLPAQAPADALRLPAVTSAVAGCHTTVVIPTDLLFQPGDVHLNGAAGVLAQARGDLSQPGASAVIGGHTAVYGSTAYRFNLSVARARAVARALAAEGVPTSRLRVVGYGSTRPAENEFPGGRHDLAAAAANRRVVIDITRRGCA